MGKGQKDYDMRKNSRNNANSLTINGKTINLTAEQVAAVAMLFAGKVNDTIATPAKEIPAVMPTVESVEVPKVEAVTETTATAPTYNHYDSDFTNFKVMAVDNVVVYTHADGSYLHEKAVREVLNYRIKANGGAWDKTERKWVFMFGSRKSQKGAQACAEAITAPVTAEEMNAVVDKWAEKAARKASRKTR